MSDSIMPISTTTEELLPVYLVGAQNGDFTDYACETHAKEFALMNGLSWNDGSTEEHVSGFYAYAVVFGGVESDGPVACHCDQYLDVRLTPEGVDYMQENDFPGWLYTAHRISR